MTDRPIELYSLALAGSLGYFLGSVPTAYLLVRWKSDRDVRAEGSGNVGTLNSYEVTGSKLVGGLVLMIDLLKGVASVILAQSILGSDFDPAAVAGVGAVVGHNFPLWLSFKGGRGLATAAGVMVVLSFVLVAFWGICWLLGYSLFRSINVGSVFATVALLVALVFLPDGLIQSVFVHEASPVALRYFGITLMSVILLKHVGAMREYFEERKEKKQDQERS